MHLKLFKDPVAISRLSSPSLPSLQRSAPHITVKVPFFLCTFSISWTKVSKVMRKREKMEREEEKSELMS